MMTSKRLATCFCLIAAISLTGCKPGGTNSRSASGSNSSSADSDSSAAGIEKLKPAPGTGNVQGKVLFNSKPVENIEVKLCETFNRFLGGCGGKIYTARTDKEGEYVIANVEPKTYEGLLARVFDTDSFVFATTGIGGLASSKYEIIADKTLFASATNLFKSDLKLLNPKAGAKVGGQDLELKWEAYPDTAYYRFSIYPEEMSVTSPYVNERVDGTSFGLNKTLEKGTYRWQVDAYNSADKKLAESADGIKFTVN